VIQAAETAKARVGGVGPDAMKERGLRSS
jgi:hypothetical protein